MPDPSKDAARMEVSRAHHGTCTDPTIARVGGADEAPVVVRRVEPAFSALAKGKAVQGIVIVEAIIDRNGRVCSTAVLRSLGPEIDAAVMEAVNQWEFIPAKKKGEPVQSAFAISVAAHPR